MNPPRPGAAGSGPAESSSGWATKVAEAVAGLVGAGVLTLGIVLLVMDLLAPHLLSGTGFSRATGPRPTRALVQVTAGALAELSRILRPRIPGRWRVWTAVLTTGCCLAAIWFAWWHA